MSFLIAPLEALTDSRLSDPERRVLLALYSFRNKNADTVWPSVDAIAARANVKDKTWISKLTKSLSEKGWLTKKKRGFTGGNEYALMVPEIATKALSNLDGEPNLDNAPNLVPDALSNLDGEPNSNLDGEPKCNELQSEQQKEQQIFSEVGELDLVGKIEQQAPAQPDQPKKQITSDVRRIFEYWVSRTGRDAARTKLTADRRSKIIARLRDGYSVEDLLAAIDGCARSSWHNGGNPEGKIHNDFGVICRNGSQVEKFRDFSVSASRSNKTNRAVPPANNAVPRPASHRCLKSVVAAQEAMRD